MHIYVKMLGIMVKSLQQQVAKEYSARNGDNVIEEVDYNLNVIKTMLDSVDRHIQYLETVTSK